MMSRSTPSYAEDEEHRHLTILAAGSQGPSIRPTLLMVLHGSALVALLTMVLVGSASFNPLEASLELTNDYESFVPPDDSHDEYHVVTPYDPIIPPLPSEHPPLNVDLFPHDFPDTRTLLSTSLALTSSPSPSSTDGAVVSVASPAPCPQQVIEIVKTVLLDLDGPLASSTTVDIPSWLNLEHVIRRIQSALVREEVDGIRFGIDRHGKRELLLLTHPDLPEFSISLRKEPASSRLAIIVDDVGLGTPSTSDLLEMNVPLAFAVMPFLRGSSHAVREAASRNFDVMLHMPMEPRRFKESVVPSIALMCNLPAEEIRRRLRNALDSFPPGIMGINNHMGSQATENPVLMEVVIDELKQRKLFFVDSVTSRNSRAYQTARQFGVPTTRRNVEFIDNRPGVEHSVSQFRRVIQWGRRMNTMIAIMHDRADSVAALQRMIPRFRAAGIELNYVSDLLDGSQQSWASGTLAVPTE